MACADSAVHDSFPRCGADAGLDVPVAWLPQLERGATAGFIDAGPSMLELAVMLGSPDLERGDHLVFWERMSTFDLGFASATRVPFFASTDGPFGVVWNADGAVRPLQGSVLWVVPGAVPHTWGQFDVSHAGVPSMSGHFLLDVSDGCGPSAHWLVGSIGRSSGLGAVYDSAPALGLVVDARDGGARSAFVIGTTGDGPFASFGAHVSMTDAGALATMVGVDGGLARVPVVVEWGSTTFFTFDAGAGVDPLVAVMFATPGLEP